MNRILPIVLLVGGVVLGILGFQKMDNSKAGVKIGDLEISAKNENKSNAATIYLILGGLLIVGGAVMMRRKSA